MANVPSIASAGSALSRRPLRPPKVRTQPPAPAPTTSSDPTFLYTPYPQTAQEWGWDQALAIPVAQDNKGYDAHAPRIRGPRRAAALNATNAVLTDGVGPGAFQMSVFVTDTSTDTALAGSNAQSNLVRDFYPRSFVQPNIAVSGVSLDQDDYALLCEFVHNAQHKAVTNGYANLTQLYVMGRNADPSKSRGFDAKRTAGLRVMLSKPGQLMGGRRRDPDVRGVAEGTYVNQLIRGSHQPILAKGYIMEMPREHERFQNAVAWEFNFVIAAMLDGIYTDAIVKESPANTWQEMLADAQKQGVVTASQQLQTENKAALQYARQHSATLL